MSVVVLQVVNASAFYRERGVLHDINLTVNKGEIVGIIGANGAGKSTLLRLLAGLSKPEKGEILLDGVPLARCRLLARRIAYLEQNPTCQWSLEAQNVVALGRLPHLNFASELSARDMRAIEEAMAEADILSLRHRPVDRLSSGERARVFLARALATEPDILLVDEPVAGLDPAHQLTVMQLLQQKAGKGISVVAVLHDLALAARFCDRLLLLHGNGIFSQGSPAEVLSDANLRAALQVKTLIGSHEGVQYVLPWEYVTN